MAKAPFDVADPGDGPAYLPGDIRNRLANAVIVYGTAREAGTNHYAAETLQARYRDRYQREVAIWKDFEATDALLAHKDVIFIARPETNSALADGVKRSGSIIRRLSSKRMARPMLRSGIPWCLRQRTPSMRRTWS
jgi:hypothetical protein